MECYRGSKHISRVGSLILEHVFGGLSQARPPPQALCTALLLGHHISCLSLTNPVPEGSGHRASLRWEIQMFSHLFCPRLEHANAWEFLPKKGFPNIPGSTKVLK